MSMTVFLFIFLRIKFSYTVEAESSTSLGIMPYTKEDVVDVLVLSALIFFILVLMLALNPPWNHKETDLHTRVAKLESQTLAILALIPTAKESTTCDSSALCRSLDCTGGGAAVHTA